MWNRGPPAAAAEGSGLGHAGLPQASATLAEMDRYVPLPDRQAALAMSRDLERNAGRPTLAAIQPSVAAPKDRKSVV